MNSKATRQVISLLIAILIIALPLFGCTNGTSSKSSSSSKTTTKTEEKLSLKPFQLKDIVVELPDTLVKHSDTSTNSVSFSFPESAKDPFAFNLYIQVQDGVNYTARDMYETEKVGNSKVKLIEANGLEFCVDSDLHDKSVFKQIFVTVGNTGYFLIVDYKQSVGSAYVNFAKDICQYISPASNSQSNSTSIPKEAIGWQDAKSHIGERVTVYGPVVKTNYAQSSNNRPTYLNLGVTYPDTSGVSVIIWGEDRTKFSSSPETLYDGETICVTGEPYMYKGQCYIKVTSPSQIRIL